MNYCTVLLLIMLALASSGQTVKLPKGTILRFEIVSMSSVKVKSGDYSELRAVPGGTPALARVAKVNSCGEIKFDQIRFPNSGVVHVKTKAPGRFDKTTALAGLGRFTVAHPSEALGSNLGPVPIILLATTPLVATIETVKSLAKPKPCARDGIGSVIVIELTEAYP